MASSTTFPVSAKHAETYGGDDMAFNSPADDIYSLIPFSANNCTGVLQMCEFPKKCDLSGQCFVNTVVDAYSFHHNLVIRPDDIWAAIMKQFSLYIKSTEDLPTGKLADKFANFGGKQNVAVTLPGTLNDLTRDSFIKLIRDEIDKNMTDADLKGWILPNFSTTTVNDTITVGTLFMASLKDSSESLQTLACGIPNVTLEGALQDFQDILDKLEKLKEYNLEKWYDLLKPVIQEFVNAKRGQVDTVFWQRICHYEPNASATSWLSGWITVFTVFDKHGKWIDSNWTPGVNDQNGDQDDETDSEDEDAPGDTKMDLKLKDWLRIDMERIADGILEVNMDLKDNKDNVFPTVMMAGHMGVEVKDDKVTIQPILGWALGLKPRMKDADGVNRSDNVDATDMYDEDEYDMDNDNGNDLD